MAVTLRHPRAARGGGGAAMSALGGDVMKERIKKLVVALMLLCAVAVAVVWTFPSLISERTADARQCDCECDWWCCE